MKARWPFPEVTNLTQIQADWLTSTNRDSAVPSCVQVLTCIFILKKWEVMNDPKQSQTELSFLTCQNNNISASFRYHHISLCSFGGLLDNATRKSPKAFDSSMDNSQQPTAGHYIWRQQNWPYVHDLLRPTPWSCPLPSVWPIVLSFTYHC